MAQKSVKPAARRASKKAPAKKKTAAKKTSVQRQAVTVKPTAVKHFRLYKPVKHPVKLPSVWQLTQTTARLIWQNKGLFFGLTIIYALLTLVLVQGLTNGTNASSLKSTFDHLTHGDFGAVSSSFGVFAILVGSSATTSGPTAGPYQLILSLITSLAIIWALRHLVSGTKIRIRDTYYRGMYPLIPFILVLLLICVQLIPFVIGARLYVTVITNGIAAHVIEKAFWLVVFLLLALWSLYMVSASVFALYVVTLPDMSPMKALRSARGLVRHRRWLVLRKVLCLPLILLLPAAIIMLPVILVATPLAQWVFFLLSMASLVPVHAYMYTLYRELLNE